MLQLLLRRSSFATLLSFALLAAAGGCESSEPNLEAQAVTAGSATRVVHSMKTADASQHQIRKVLVVAMHTQPQFRNPMEDAIASNLRARGLETVTAHTVIPDAMQVNREHLKQEAQRNGCDTVLIAGVLSRKDVDVMDPGMAVGGRGEFRAGYPALSYQSYQQAPTSTDERQVVLETKVFDANTESLLWVARSEAVIQPNITPRFPVFAQSIGDKMQQDGLLPATTTTST
jgi:hypothetical protein